MIQRFKTNRLASIPDLLIILLVGSAIYGVVTIASEFQSSFHPATDIDLSIWALPKYSLFSAMRGLAAYILSLLFTIVIGYAAAKSKSAERILIPMIDILQSIPVLAFLPGLVLGLIALFPKTNMGLELAAIIMIFTGQVWNMTFSFYSSLKSIPSDFDEASNVIGLNWWQRLWRLEMPFSAVGLAWNSLMSMAGGWFFLSVCEAFTLGDLEYRLPGVGAYMAMALKEGNTTAMIYGIVAMVSIILLLDFVIWRPILSWVRRFRLEEVPGAESTEPIMLLVLRESRMIRYLKAMYRRRMSHRRGETEKASNPMKFENFNSKLDKIASNKAFKIIAKFVGPILWLLVIALVIWGMSHLIKVWGEVSSQTWLELLAATGLTFLRVLGALIISSIWAVPLGIWIGLSQRRTRIAQPIIQVLASFPAPMLYPLALAVFFGLGMQLGLSSMFLMLLGVQWYVLFNVLAGALRISQELGDTLSLMNTSRRDRWRTLYLPSVLPALVTGWITAAGGAWNASIVAEYISYKGQVLTVNGIGATISKAAAEANFPLLAASLTIMVAVVLSLNRVVWHRVYAITQTRFKMD